MEGMHSNLTFNDWAWDETVTNIARYHVNEVNISFHFFLLRLFVCKRNMNFYAFQLDYLYIWKIKDHL